MEGRSVHKCEPSKVREAERFGRRVAARNKLFDVLTLLSDREAPILQGYAMTDNAAPFGQSDPLDEEVGEVGPRKFVGDWVEIPDVDDYEFLQLGCIGKDRLQEVHVVVRMPPPNDKGIEGGKRLPFDSSYGCLGVDA
jgi:hypothetical protein